MDSVKLAEALRRSAVQLNEDDAQDVWLGVVRPLLPSRPLTRGFIKGVLETVPPGVCRAGVLRLLSRLGRAEVADAAAELDSGEEDGTVRLLIAETLIALRDERGYAIIEALFMKSLDSGKPDVSKVPLSWIDEVLAGFPDDGRAEKLRTRLVVARCEREMERDAEHGRRVGDLVFSVSLDSDGGVGCVPADLDRGLALTGSLVFLWNRDAGRFVSMLESRAGASESECSVSYQPPAGEAVRVVHGDAEETYPRPLFEEAACVFALTALELLRKAGRPVPDGLETRLRAVRARI